MKNIPGREKARAVVAIKHLDRAIKAMPDTLQSKAVLMEAKTICIKELRGELAEYMAEQEAQDAAEAGDPKQ